MLGAFQITLIAYQQEGLLAATLSRVDNQKWIGGEIIALDQITRKLSTFASDMPLRTTVQLLYQKTKQESL